MKCDMPVPAFLNALHTSSDPGKKKDFKKRKELTVDSNPSKSRSESTSTMLESGKKSLPMMIERYRMNS